MRLVVDRIEQETVVCEELSERKGILHTFRLSELPAGVKEGDVLDCADNTITRNPEAACERKERVRKLMDDVFE